MGSVHQLAEFCNIVDFQRCHRLDGSLVFIDGMLRPLFPGLILDGILVLLESFLCQVAQALNVHHFL